MSKTALITGATSGIGAASAQRFAAAGWKLILTGRRCDRLEEMCQLLGTAVSATIALDVRDRQGILESFQEFATIDLLINNAGLALGLDAAWDVDLDDWDTMIDTNIKGLTYCTRAILPRMVERNCGHIINIGSTAGSWPYPGGNVYGGTKAFVQQFSRNLRADLLGTRVRITNIDPGMAESEFSTVRFKGNSDQAAAVYAGTEPLKPEDIAEVIYFVATLPPHVNVNTLEMMSINQAWGGLKIHRDD